MGNTQVLLRGGLGKREAEPEADAYYGYGGYGGYGTTYGLVSACHNAYGAPVPCRGKRSAEAEPYYGGIGYGYGAYVPPTGLPVQPLVTAWNGAVVPRKTPAVEAAEADHYAAKFGKREADSEADAYYGYGGYGGYGLGYGGYGYGGLGYGDGKRSADADADAYFGYCGYGLAILGKSAPCVNAANIPVPCAAPPGIWKREADSEADAYYGYGGLYGGYGGYGLGYGYGGYGYGKRSADSEADAYYGYGGYGGYGLSYGGYGYGGLGYGYGKRSATEKKKTATLTVGRTCFGYDAKTCAKLQKGHF